MVGLPIGFVPLSNSSIVRISVWVISSPVPTFVDKTLSKSITSSSVLVNSEIFKSTPKALAKLSINFITGFQIFKIIALLWITFN